MSLICIPSSTCAGCCECTKPCKERRLWAEWFVVHHNPLLCHCKLRAHSSSSLAAGQQHSMKNVLLSMQRTCMSLTTVVAAVSAGHGVQEVPDGQAAGAVPEVPG